MFSFLSHSVFTRLRAGTATHSLTSPGFGLRIEEAICQERVHATSAFRRLSAEPAPTAVDVSGMGCAWGVLDSDSWPAPHLYELNRKHAFIPFMVTSASAECRHPVASSLSLFPAVNAAEGICVPRHSWGTCRNPTSWRTVLTA